ncbi:ribosomal protein L2 [Rickenella mellea]|uniref:Large ribosomal subunit protein uL2m n=1 Tax=Rickenella mellea TaxID=50990 RepID=A0A4Y7QFE8_9AGAM|nr:ribosomal protein L2 [Rickenella mellea]
MFARAGCSLIRARTVLQSCNYATEVVVKPAAAISEALARTEQLFKTYKPITPGRRHLRRPINDHLYEGRPLRLLTIPRRKTGGRNSDGRITVRGIGGGHKQRIRTVDFMRTDSGPQDVIRIEYDPGRSAHIALVRARDARANGGKRFSYILAPEGMRAGHVVESFRNGIPDNLVPGFVDTKKSNRTQQNSRSKSSESTVPSPAAPSHNVYLDLPKQTNNLSFEESAMMAEATTPTGVAAVVTPDNVLVEPSSPNDTSDSNTASLALSMLLARVLHPGNVLPLRIIPTGTVVHCIALHPDKPGILVRSAGSSAVIIEHDPWGNYTQVRLQSGEVRKVLSECCATIGSVSNPLWKGRKLGKAGRNRWLGHRPRVRGVAMNRVDHPHGGGRGKSKGNKHPRSIWGWLTKGRRTRRPGPKGPKNSNKMVVRERPRGKERIVA